jgi:uncharacterized protein YgiM (DUF1202 family)
MLKRIWFLALLWLSAAAPALAAEDCRALIQSLALAARDACAVIEHDQVCAGSSATVTTWDGTKPAFDQPGAVINAADVKTLQTNAYDGRTWGLAVMSLRANSTFTVQWQKSQIIVFGNVQLENEVKPEQVAIFKTLRAKTTDGVNVRSGPGKIFDVQQLIKFGEVVTLVERDLKNEWARIDTDGWISLSFLKVEGDSASLPIYDPAAVNADYASSKFDLPLQSFRLRTGSSTSPCDQPASGGLLIQSVNNDIPAVLRINGTPMSVQGTALVRVNRDGLRVTALDGETRLKLPKAGRPIATSANEMFIRDGRVYNYGRYEAENVRDLPLALLNRTIALVAPRGVLYTMFTCSYLPENSGRKFLRFQETLTIVIGTRSDTISDAYRYRDITRRTLTLDGSPVEAWSTSFPYRDSQQGSASPYFVDWYWVAPRLKPGTHELILVSSNTGNAAIDVTYRCTLTVQ